MLFTHRSITRAALTALLVPALALTACDSDEPAEEATTTTTAEPEPEPEPQEAVDATLAPGFTPNPQVLTGVAGGERQGHHWTGRAPHTDCTGYFPDEPQHTVALEDIEQMSILATAPVDLTLAVEGPHGVWCNDDYQGLDPGFVESWEAGTYHIYVGIYDEGVRANYTLTLREVKPAETVQTTLSPGFGVERLTSIAGGPRPGSEWTGVSPHTDCTGHMPAEPQHEIELTEDISNLRVVASHSIDLTMVIEGPEGVWCNDDFEGLDPGLLSAFPAGTYKIFIGTFDGEFAPDYSLTLTDFSSTPTTEASLAPGFLPDPHLEVSVAGGSREGSTWTGEGEHTDCTGYFPDEPQHILELEEFESLTIKATTEETDLTMVIEGPQGTWCNDDFEGYNPGIRDTYPAGTYRVFIGTYSPDMAAYTLQVTEF